MGSMEEVIYTYKQRKFRKCLDMIALLKETDENLNNFVLENCRLICESYVSINENDPDKLFEMQEEHYLFFEKVTSLNFHPDSIPLELRLNVTFNFTYWLLFYTDVELGAPEEEEYLELINKGLLTVLGKEVTAVTSSKPSEKVLSNLMCLKNLILIEEQETVFLILELVTVIILYVIKLKKNLVKECLTVVSSFIKESKHTVNSVTGEKEFLRITSTSSLILFKFSFYGSGSLSSDINSGVIDYLYILESVFLYLLEDFKGSLKSLQKNLQTSVSTLWSYVVILNSYELGDWNLCSKFLIKTSSLAVHNSLKTRLHIMQGKLNCVERNHKEALKEFKNALLLSPNCPIIYYYMGQEYGKMGLMDSMVENFEKLLQVLQIGDLEEDFKPNFETILLDWIHPVTEITEVEAYYALAVAYGMNESFKNAAEAFEKVLESVDHLACGRNKGVVSLPSYLTILHEASIMNLLLGNLVRAEQIALDAIDRYVAQKLPEIRESNASLLCKDVEWLERVIQQELLETDLEPKQLSKEIHYSEDLLMFLPRNVIGLLILAEIQRIQEIDDYKSTLSNVFTIFSKYLACTQKKEELDEKEKHALTLVKALAGKTCVRIANVQMQESGDSNIEKMFKRALSCNKGDKDALHNYYKFLLRVGKSRDALKLWNTFSKEKVSICIDSLQSFSLRYFLTDTIRNRELEKIQRDIETADVLFS